MNMNKTPETLARLVKKMPLRLRIGLSSREMLMAIDEEYVLLTPDGRMVWQLESNTLLAYFCGRLWCGDKPVYSRRLKGCVWKRGKRPFPNKALERLFGVQNLYMLRLRRTMRAVPMGYEYIDQLFENEEVR